MAGHAAPDLDRIREMFAGAGDEPVVMLNLNRYRDRAQYPPGHPDAELGLSGREAYSRYGIVALAAVAAVGGRILWATTAHEVVIGCEHDRYDDVIAVWYPSRDAFTRLEDQPGYMDAHVHRDAALEQATLLALGAEHEPVLADPGER